MENGHLESKLKRSYLAIQAYIFFVCAGQAFFSYDLLFLKSVAGLSLLDLGLIGSITTFSTMLLTIPSGWLPDKIGKRKSFVMSSLILMAIITIIYPLGYSFETFLLMNLLIAVANLFILGPMYNALLMGIIGSVEAGKRIGRYRIWGSLSWIVLQPVCGVLAGRFGLSILFPISGALYVVAAVITLFIYEPQWKGKSDSVMPSNDITKERNDNDLKKCLVQRDIIVLVIAQAINGFVGHGLSFLDIYLKQIGVSLEVLGLIKGLWAIPEIPSLLFFPKLSDKIGRWKVIALSFFVRPIGFFIYGATSDIYVLFFAQIATTLLTFGSSQVTTIYTSELVPNRYRASVFAITSELSGLPGIPGQYLSGYLGGTYGLPTMYLIQGLISLVPPAFFTAANARKSSKSFGASKQSENK